MKNKIYQIYDSYFKKNFADIKVAISFLKAHLDAKILKQIDLNTLRIVPAAFVDDHLAKSYSDIVYMVYFKNSNIPLYIIVEAQSTPDKEIFLRLMEYTLELMRQEKKDDSKLPLVITIVLYTGKYPYNIGTSSADFFPKYTFERKHLFAPLSYTLINLQTIDDSKLADHGTAALPQMLLKQGTHKNFCEWIEKNKKHFQKAILQCSYYNVAILYIFALEEEENEEKLRELLTELHPNYKKENIMTIENKYIQKGIQQGVQKTIYDLFNAGVTSELIKKGTGLSQKEVEKILKNKS